MTASSVAPVRQTRIFLALCFSAGAGAACSHAPVQASLQQQQAQQAVAQAEAGLAAHSASGDLQHARQQLHKAQRAAGKGDAPLADTLAYVAERAAQTAEAHAGAALASAQQQRADDALQQQRAQGALLARSTLQATRQQHAAQQLGLAGALSENAPELALGLGQLNTVTVALPPAPAFARNSSQLLPRAKAQLRSVAQALREHQAQHVSVAARVQQPKAQAMQAATPQKQALARARTQAVMAYLISRGVNASCVSALASHAGAQQAFAHSVLPEGADNSEVQLWVQTHAALPHNP